MNTIYPKFSFNRVKSILLWLLAVNKNRLIKLLVIAFTSTYLYIVVMKMWNLPDYIISSIMGLAFFVTTSILASSFLEPAIDTKNKRLKFLSMPAQRKEKTLVAMTLFIFKIIGLVLVIDTLSLLFNLIGDCKIGLILPYLNSCDNMMQFWFGISFMLAFWAVNMVVGIIYPKYGIAFVFCMGSTFGIKMVERFPSVMESHSLLSIFPPSWIGYTGIIICSVVFLICLVMALLTGKIIAPIDHSTNIITLIEKNPLSKFLRKK